MFFLFINIFITLSFLSLSIAEDLPPISPDRPHGLPDETPPPISPDEYKFFHPGPTYLYNIPKLPFGKPPSDMPLAATVKSTPAQESFAGPTKGGHEGLGAGCIAGVSLSFVFVCIVGMVAYLVMVRRRANSYRANAKHDLA